MEKETRINQLSSVERRASLFILNGASFVALSVGSLTYQSDIILASSIVGMAISTIGMSYEFRKIKEIEDKIINDLLKSYQATFKSARVFNLEDQLNSF